jgi:hypothetical protein
MHAFFKGWRQKVGCGLLVMALVCGVALIIDYLRTIHVTVINGGQEALVNVVIQVTGRQYQIGSLAAGQSRTVRVLPEGESSVTVSFTDHAGNSSQVDADAYIETGSCGTILLEIEDSALKRNDQNTGYRIF